MAIEVIRKGNRAPSYYFLKCDLCHSTLRFVSQDVDAYRVWNKDEAYYQYYYFLKCPLCGLENAVSCFSENWATSEEELKGDLNV